MDPKDARRAHSESRRYRLHNETSIPDLGLVAEEYLSAPKSVRRGMTLAIVAIIMFIPIVAVVLALLR